MKVKDTDDLIEINLDKDRPESFVSEQAMVEWEMASAKKVPTVPPYDVWLQLPLSQTLK